MYAETNPATKFLDLPFLGPGSTAISDTNIHRAFWTPRDFDRDNGASSEIGWIITELTLCRKNDVDSDSAVQITPHLTV